MDFYKLRTSECRIAVVGLLAAGKTVFLTSLINHLKDHEPSRFHAGQRRPSIVRFHEIATDEGWERFPYRRYRDAIISRQWPDKTTDRLQFACEFNRSDWRIHRAKVKFYDLPGERIADAVMAIHDYAAWSDHYVGLLEDDHRYRACTSAFLEALHSPDATEPSLLTHYKMALGRLIHAFKANVSPSTFLLDLNGRRNKAESPEVMAKTFFAGLDETSQFVPLSRSARLAWPEMAVRFSANYEAYKKKVVLPVVKCLSECHSLIVLVDVLMLLAGGVGMYNDNHQLIVDLLQVVKPGGAFHNKVLSALCTVLPHGWRPGGISRIAFVAPKMDQVWPEDRNHMPELLRQMVGKPASDLENVQTEFFNCSAVLSTESIPAQNDERWLRGVPMYDANCRRIAFGAQQAYRVNALPSEWPAQWSAGDHSFPDVYPLMPTRKDCPPNQIHLDMIFNFVTGSK